MKKLLSGVCLACMVTAFAAQNNSGLAVTVTGTAEATILEAVTLTAGDMLDFGTIIPGAGDSVVTIAAVTGGRSRTGDAVLATSGAGNDGTFIIGADDGSQISVDLPENGEVTIAEGINTMQVDDFTWAYNGGAVQSADGNVTLSGAGPHTLSVGASLTVPASTAAAVYSGTYNITINYQ